MKKSLSKRLVALLCILVMLCAALPVLADVEADHYSYPTLGLKLKYLSQTYTQYIDLRDVMASGEAEVIDMGVDGIYDGPVPEKEMVFNYKVELLESNPSKGGIRVSDNCIMVIPAGFAGYSNIKMRVSWEYPESSAYKGEPTRARVIFNVVVSPKPATIHSIRSTEKGVVNLTWGTILNADSYRVFYTTNPESGKFRYVDVDGNSLRLTKLKPGKTYYFMVASIVNIDNNKYAMTDPSTTATKSVVVYPQVQVESFMVLVAGKYGNQDGRVVKCNLGKTLKVKATAFKPSYATKKTIVWNSSDKNVAIISSNGVINTLSRGSTLITAKTCDGSGSYCSFTLIVK